MATQKQRQALHFIFILIATAAMLPGCSSTVAVGCPEGEPVDGGACPEPSMNCGYAPTDPCVLNFTAICGDTLQWMIAEVVDESCAPSSPCPGDVPPQSSPCEGQITCSYLMENACGPTPVDAICGEDGLWQVSDFGCDTSLSR